MHHAEVLVREVMLLRTLGNIDHAIIVLIEQGEIGICRKHGASVEAEPTEPQQEDTHRRHRQVAAGRSGIFLGIYLC